MSNVITLLIYVAWFAGMWKVFEKAGKPGWAAIIPIYNIIVLLEIIKKPIWWLLLCFIIIGMILIAMELAECFGKSKGWGIGLLFFLPFIGYPLLGFGDAAYKAPSA